MLIQYLIGISNCKPQKYKVYLRIITHNKKKQKCSFVEAVIFLEFRRECLDVFKDKGKLYVYIWVTLFYEQMNEKVTDLVCVRAGMPASVKDEVGDVEAALDLESIPPKVQEYARDVLGETPETRVRALQELSDIIYGKF